MKSFTSAFHKVQGQTGNISAWLKHKRIAPFNRTHIGLVPAKPVGSMIMVLEGHKEATCSIGGRVNAGPFLPWLGLRG